MFGIRALFYYVLCLTTSCHAISRHPIIMIVAFDGFRYDYIDRGFTPTLKRLAESGVSTPFMYNVFPTLTWPNFFSISTGFYPEVHGVFGNENFDQHFNCLGDHKRTEEFLHYNEDILPLWILNEMSGDDRYSATYFWPTSQVKFRNRTARYNVHDENITFEARISMAVDAINSTDAPANLVFLYFNEPDYKGHTYGPNSLRVEQELRGLDGNIQYLMDVLTEKGLLDKVNLMFLSDHGMVQRSNVTEGVIDLESYIRPEFYSKCGGSPVWQIQPVPKYVEEIHANLTSASKKLNNTFTVYRQEELPDRWHIKHSNRTCKIWVVAKEPYVFKDAENDSGVHGYDDSPELRPFFFAIGPLFKSNASVPPFKNIDIFPLVSSILKLNAPPESLKPNGTLTEIQKILHSSAYRFQAWVSLLVVCYLIVLIR